MNFDDAVPVLLAACIGAAGLLAVAPKLLFRWYLREVRKLQIPRDPGDAIATYPFA
jgi:hypothetical protein